MSETETARETCARLYRESQHTPWTNGPGWRNAREAAARLSPSHVAACWWEGATEAQSKSAAWSRSEAACEAIGMHPGILGRDSWPDTHELAGAIAATAPAGKEVEEAGRMVAKARGGA